jgi:4-amino-4-deoxy-L-arabinose transferase-like glycosyltransferase
VRNFIRFMQRPDRCMEWHLVKISAAIKKDPMKSWIDSLPSPSHSLRRVVAIVAVIALLGFYAVEVTLTSRALSATWNEPYHLLAGYTYWHQADYGVNPEHPPLAKLVGTLPLLFMHLQAPHVGKDDSKLAANRLGVNFVYQNDADSMLMRARLAEALMGLTLLVLMFEAGNRMFGAGIGWIALVLGVFEPNLLAHSTLVTTDLCFTLFYLAAIYALWRVADQSSPRRLAACGVMSGLALASKHSALLLIPTLALLAAVEIGCQLKNVAGAGKATGPASARGIRAWTGRLIVIYTLAVLVLWGFYGFRFQARPDGLPLWSGIIPSAAPLKGHVARWAVTTAAHFKLLPQSYLFGLIDVMIVTAGPRMSFLREHLYPHSLWYYFPVAFVIKSTIGFLGILSLGLVAVRSWAGERYHKAAYLLIPPALLLGAALTAGTNLGVRHILPIYPFLILAASAGAMELVRRGKAWAIVVAVLMILHIASSLHTLPNYLAYSNELFGGTANTYRNLSDSNADWGQGLLEARQYLAQRNIKDCWFAYIGTADTAYYHLPCKMLPNPFLKRQEAVPPDLFHGVVLISGTNIAGSYFGAGALNPYSDFLKSKPVANIGGSVLVYEGDIDLRSAAATAHMLKAWEFFDAKNQEAAIQEALKAGDLAPDHPGPPYIVGYMLAQAHRTGAARAQLEASLKLAEAPAHPEFQPVWANAAKAQLALLPK